jgi:hypothetical protein
VLAALDLPLPRLPLALLPPLLLVCRGVLAALLLPRTGLLSLLALAALLARVAAAVRLASSSLSMPPMASRAASLGEGL